MEWRNFCMSIKCKEHLTKHKAELAKRAIKVGTEYIIDDIIYIPYQATKSQIEKDIMKYVAKCITNRTI